MTYSIHARKHDRDAPWILSWMKSDHNAVAFSRSSVHEYPGRNLALAQQALSTNACTMYAKKETRALLISSSNGTKLKNNTQHNTI